MSGISAAGLFAIARGGQPASAGALRALPRPGPSLRVIANVLIPTPRTSGLDDVGMCGGTAAGCVGLVVGRPGLAARGLGVASGSNSAAAGGVGAWGRAMPGQHDPLKGDAVDSLVEGADHQGRAATGAGARSNHAVVVG